MLRILSLLFLILIALPYDTYGFCISNKYSDGSSFFARQIAGFGRRAKHNRRFKKFGIVPDQLECCSHETSDCNASGNPDDIIKFWIVAKTTKGYVVGNYEIDCPAGGSIEITGTAYHPAISVRYFDGRPYQYSIEHNPKTHWYFADMKKTRKQSIDKKEEGKEEDENEDMEKDEE